MSSQSRWFDRRFDLGLDASAARELLDRLRAAPARLAAAVRDLPVDALTRRPEGKWSIQENAGHLFDLESLWDQRLDDFERGAATLHVADLENRRTHEAGHNDRAIDDILADFSKARAQFVRRLEQMRPEELARTALHPRLQQPMTVVDLCFFVAEHDDHHLETIRRLRAAFVNS